MYKEFIITSKKARVRKSCYPCILRLRYLFFDSALTVYASTRVLTVRRYLQRANMENYGTNTKYKSTSAQRECDAADITSLFQIRSFLFSFD